MTQTIRLEGADELIKKLDSIQAMKRVKAAIKAAAEDLQGRMREYPTHTSRPNPLIKLDPKVRRGFFYHLRKGDIEVPYRRGQSPGSQKLGQSWTVRSQNYGFKAIIGTKVSYARLVQDSAQQTSYHRHTGWITTKQAVMLYGADALRSIEDAFKQEIEHG